MAGNNEQLTQEEIAQLLDGWYERVLGDDLKMVQAIEIGAAPVTRAQYRDQQEAEQLYLNEILENLADVRIPDPNRPDLSEPRPTKDQRREALEAAARWMTEEAPSVLPEWRKSFD